MSEILNEVPPPPNLPESEQDFKKAADFDPKFKDLQESKDTLTISGRVAKMLLKSCQISNFEDSVMLLKFYLREIEF